MAIIPAVVTNSARTRWPQMHGGLVVHKLIKYFRVGEGGWFWNPIPGERQPRTPDASLTNLDIILDAGRSAPSKRYDVAETFGYYRKNLVSTDFTYESNYILRVSCLLDFPEYNSEDDGTLIYDEGAPYTNPEIWEIGLFDEDNVMVVYGTITKQTKQVDRQVENIVRIVY